MILVDLADVGARRPDRALFEDLCLTVASGDRIGVVGRNGGGKSTLLRVLAGEAEPDEGTVRRGKGVRIGFLSQRPVLPPGTVGDAVGTHWEAAAIIDRLGMAPLTGADVATLSGGQAKRVALARVLVAEVDLLVLDEPTNHLDLDAVRWLEDRLARFSGGLVLVTHDRHVLDRVTTRVLELDRGHGFVHDGGYQTYLDARVERADKDASAEAVRRNLARVELAWLRRGAPARTRKSKSRIASATAIVDGRPPPPDRPEALDLGAARRGVSTPRLGDRVVVLHGVGHRYTADDPWLFTDLDLDLAPGGRLGVVGPNGSGKSTLLDIMAGRLAPGAGSVEIGPTVRIGYYDQAGRDLDPSLRVRDAVAGNAGQPSWEQARLMERFWFDDDAQWAPIGTLSGGERRRLQLLLVLADLPNVVILDEPTNDLDLDTLRVVEDHLDGWPGSVVVVSHDRAHLERTVEDILVLDGRGATSMPPGGFAAYEATRQQVRTPKLAASARSPRVHRTSAEAEAPAEPARKQRSPSTVRRLIAETERDLAAASGRRDQLSTEMRSRSDHAALAQLATELAAAEARMGELEERWLELADELGG
ncbi:MAG: ATP-binding cassette domain-containing protein [Actinomycetota bacterium]|nr:ATP-binding cassette domain-containing protein [Actinomycetota bacterium]